jgi:peptidoglycan/xylan/chitin deacetylase (PgdA/CDA1 family)
MRTLLLRPAQAALMAASALKGHPVGGVNVLIYHQVGGDVRSELDVDPCVFAAQLAHLAASGRIMSLPESLAALGAGGPRDGRAFVLTFDDGYADFHATVFPLLVALGIPATVYVTTGFVEGEHSPLSGRRPPAVRPMTWEMLRDLHGSGLVTVGAHSHAHRDYVGLTEREVEVDIDRSSELFERHLGFVPRHFAYPRARFDAVAESVVRRRYESAAVGGGGRAVPGAFDAHRIPRVPVRRSDGMLFFKAKVRGLLGGEERLIALGRAALGR